MKQLITLIIVLLIFGNTWLVWGYPGTYKGDKILTNFGIDSLIIGGETRYYNLDSLVFLIMTEGYTPKVQNINVHYFVDIVDELPYDKQHEQMQRLRFAAGKYKSKQLAYEADFISIWYFPTPNDSLFQIQMNMLDNFIHKMHKAKEYEFEIRARELAYELCIEHDEYARPFKEFPIIDKLLDNIPDINKSGVNGASKKKFYYRFGQMYSKFRDYDKAVYYFKKALIEPTDHTYAPYHLYDETNLMARNELGLYYRTIGNLDSSDFYFHSMLECLDSVKRRDLTDAIAYYNLGQNHLLKGQYDEAIQLLEQGFPVLVRYENHRTIEASIALGEAWLAKNELTRTKEAIGRIRGYNHFAINNDNDSRFYQLLRKYYTTTKDNQLSALYLDSALIAKEKLDKKYNALILLRAEQETFAAEKAAGIEAMRLQKENHRNVLIASILIISLCMAALMVFIYLYRKKREAYRELVRKSRQWAQQESPKVGQENTLEADKQPDETDLALMSRLNELLETDKDCIKGDIKLDTLAQRLGTSHVQLSRAVNRSTGKNFSQLINEYRIREAVRILSDKSPSKLTIDAVAFESGFNDRRSFYRVFKSVTGLSPSDFRKNLTDDV